MMKKLCPETVQNYVKNMPKYAMATGAETNGAFYGNQKIFTQNSLKIIDRNQKPILSDLRKTEILFCKT